MFAELKVAMYQWPDEPPLFGYIIYTNCEDDLKAAEMCGVTDEMVLIYTDTLDTEEIARNFDGLHVEFIEQE